MRASGVVWTKFGLERVEPVCTLEGCMNIQEMQMSPFLFMKASFLGTWKKVDKSWCEFVVEASATFLHDFDELKADCNFWQKTSMYAWIHT